MKEMPNKTTYIALIVVGFLCGILWGVLSLVHYSPMTNAITLGDAETAWKEAKLIKTFTLIGIVVNVVAILLFSMSS